MLKLKNKIINFDVVALIFCISLLTIYLSPYFINVDNSYFLVHDNLNSNVIWYSRIADQKYLFANNDVQVPFMFNGIPRGCYPSEYNLYIILFTFFSPIAAYCINLILLHLVAFVGSILLLKKYFLQNVNTSYIYLIALCYAILPFWPSGQIGVAGMPLLLYALLNLHFETHKKISWSIVLFFPFYSSFIFSNVFFIVFFSLAYLAFSLFRKEKLKYQVITALSIFVLISLLVEYRLLYMQFAKHIITHRSLYKELTSSNLNYFGWLGAALRYFFFGQYHFYSYHYFLLILSVPVAIISSNKYRMEILLILLFMLMVSLQTTSASVPALIWLNKLLALKNSMQLRFTALFPLLSLILFSIIVKVLILKGKNILAYAVIAIQLLLVGGMVFPGDYSKDVFTESAFYNTHISGNYSCRTFKRYFVEDLFAKVSKVVPPGDYNILAIGFESQIVQLSNYNTIDGYHYFYPVEKTMMIKKILTPFINKNPEVKVFLGSRISISKILKNKEKSMPKNLDLDFETLRANNCKYIFSTDSLNNPEISLFKQVKEGKGGLYIYELLQFPIENSIK